MQIGGTRRIETEFYQPVSRDRDWFVSAAYGYRASDVDVFDGEHRVARLAFSEKKVGVFLGRQLGLIGEIRIGHSRYQASAESLIFQSPTESASARYYATDAQLRLDTLDSANFPRHGYSLGIFGQRAQFPLGIQAPRSRHGFGGTLAVSSGPYTLLSALQYTAGENGGAIPIGGFLALSGTPVESISGDKIAFGRIVGFRRIGQLPGALGGSVYAGASLELGGAFTSNESVTVGGMKRAGALILGLETILGPVYFGTGKTWHGSSAVYLFVGQP
jgi:NTE family protein